MVMTSIEDSNNLSKMTIDELSGLLFIVEEKNKANNKGLRHAQKWLKMIKFGWNQE